MGLSEGGKQRLTVLALMMGVCLTPSCVSTAPSVDAAPAAEAVPPAVTTPPAEPKLSAETAPFAQAKPPAETTPPAEPPPPAGQDWRTLRRIDLPATLVRATWSSGSFMAQGHPMQFGRTAITMPNGVAKTGIVKAAKNALDGLLVDELTCYNSVRGERKCLLLLNPPDRCYLFIFADLGAPDGENFDVPCPARLTLGQ